MELREAVLSRLIAERLNTTPQQIWPSRYNEDGTLRDGPPPVDPVERLRASSEVVASAE